MRLFRDIRMNAVAFSVLTVACLLALAMPLVTYHGLSNIHNNLKSLIGNSLSMSSALQSTAVGAAEMNMVFRRLSMHNAPQDVSYVRQVMQETRGRIDQGLALARSNASDHAQEMNELTDLFQRIYTVQEVLLRGVTSMSLEAVGTFMEQRLDPLYERLHALLESMQRLPQESSALLAEASEQSSRQTLWLVVAASVLLVLLAVIVNVQTRRQWLEKARSEAVLRGVAEHAGTAFLIYNVVERRVDYVSPNMARVSGVTVQALREDPCELFARMDRGDVETASQDPYPTQTPLVGPAAEFCQVFDAEVLQMPMERVCHVPGDASHAERWLSCGIYPIRDESRVVRYVVTVSDQTERQRDQQALRDALHHAENASSAKSDFLSHMSHEIRTPMNAIIGMTTIALSAQGDAARVQDCLTKIGLSSRHLLMLINDVLDMAKIESGKFELVREPFSLNELVRNLTAIIYPQTQERGLRFSVSIGDLSAESFVGDALRLNQALLNLLSNALKFTPRGGSISLRIAEISRKGSALRWLRFTISDTGCGMSPEFLQRIFKPFEQDQHQHSVHREQKRSLRGTGLGLAITRNIVNLMHGNISVDSEPGVGSTFMVDVGFAPDAGSVSAPRHKELEVLRVLVVDDERESCEYAALLLRKIGVTAEWVQSGAEAVQRITEGCERHDFYDVVLLDWRMPGMDGIETARRIRECVGMDTLILILSAYDWGQIEQEARGAGVHAFIAKPLFQSTIYNTLLAVTQGGEGRRPETATAVDLHGRRLLLVEDDELNREIAVEILRQTGAVIHTAVNGQEAVNSFQNSEPGFFSAVLMDVQMPILNGYEATRAIRALRHPDARQVPIIAMTANAFAEDIAAALGAGMNAHLSKPIDTGALYQCLAQEIFRREKDAA